MTVGVLFPGQGSQFVGMGADLFDARDDLLGEAADDVLGWSLREMCLEGPEDALTRTEHAQPAIFAISYALWVELTARTSIAPAGAAGHSLGEYTALAAAETLPYFDALRLVATRGTAMASAADAAPSGMAALLGADEATAAEVAEARRAEGGQLWVANVNAPGQIVVAGASADIDWITTEARQLGIRRAVPLAVAGAFHSPFMEPAATTLASALEGAGFEAPRFPVWSNVSAVPHDQDIPSALVAQLTGTVRFAASLGAMADAGIETFVHVGPGDVTAGLAKRSVEGTEPIAVSSLDDIDAAVSLLADV